MQTAWATFLHYRCRSRNDCVEDWENQLECFPHYFFQMWSKPLSCTQKKRWRRKAVLSPVCILNTKKKKPCWTFVQSIEYFKACKSLKTLKTCVNMIPQWFVSRHIAQLLWQKKAPLTYQAKSQQDSCNKTFNSQKLVNQPLFLT